MYLIVTKTFPPEVGGMQNLMWGLANELSKHYMIKVFADYHENHKLFDEQVSFSIERVGGIKLLRKYRKAQLINEFIKENKITFIIKFSYYMLWRFRLIKGPRVHVYPSIENAYRRCRKR